MKSFPYRSFGILVVGILVLTLAVFFLAEERRFIHNALPVESIITGIESYRDSDNDLRKEFRVEYVVNGAKYSSLLSYYHVRMGIGDTIVAYYRMDDPAVIRVHSYLGGILFGIIGILLTFVGVLIARYDLGRWKWRKKHVSRKPLKKMDRES